jgi:hypothetical protein
MIIVTGTRRSGTSVWMQILEKGGFQIIGEKFPAHWQSVVEEANPRGFYESTLVQGINYHTNPEPRSGAWIPPDKVSDYAVKIFADGLVKTDFAYIGKVIFSIRKWQECEASQERMEEIKARHPELADGDQHVERAARLPTGFTWWKANFSLVRDMQTRRYPVVAFSYEALLRNPETVCSAVFEWLGGGDATAAASVVDHALQTQQNVTLPNADHDYADVFDELYDTLHANRQITPAFYKKLVATDGRITQEINALLA